MTLGITQHDIARELGRYHDPDAARFEERGPRGADLNLCLEVGTRVRVFSPERLDGTIVKLLERTARIELEDGTASTRNRSELHILRESAKRT